MPTYQYACKDPDCGNRFELVQAFTDPAASECPVSAVQVRATAAVRDRTI